MKKTTLMGILNTTPDSFFDNGHYFDHSKAILRALEMEKEGADIIDIGGESTRPGATPVSEQEELNRTIAVIAGIRTRSNISISIDTMKPEVAAQAIKAGATLINDVGGFQNSEMVKIASVANCDICVMHMQGNPQNMQNNPEYSSGIIDTLLLFFEERMQFLLDAGIKKEKIIMDPGLGFGKSIADNLEIIHNLPKLKRLNIPLLLGISRKSFMGKIVNQPPSSLLPATLALNTVAMMSNVDIIRVHDVKEHRMIIDIMHKYLEL
jgi:dihydropteroate synthase